MPHTIEIRLPDAVLDALETHGEVRLTLEVDEKKSRLKKGPTKHGRIARPGSLPQRITEWARSRNRSFGPTEVMAEFDVSRAHASMLLTTLVKRGAIHRAARGVYEA